MFKVLFPPFDPSLLISIEAHVALVYEGKRKVRFIVADCGKDPEIRLRIIERFNITAECLNTIKSHSFACEMLRSIQYAIQRAEEDRRQSYARPPVRISHRADFGRLDFDRPGQGGTGVDGYW